MKEFKTLGPTQFGVGDGVKTRFSIARPGDIVRDSNIESVRRVGWQGDQLLRPYPRTNLAIASNDFTNSAWQGSPSLYINFLSGTIPGSVDFSRASTATYVGRDRLIHTAAINEPRFTYDPTTGHPEGLLVEGQATNLFQWSEDFTQSSWSTARSSLLPNSNSSPDGSISATKLIEDTDTGTHAVYTSSIPITPGGTICVSVFVKAGERSKCEIRSQGSTGWVSRATASFDLETGQLITGNGGIYPAGGGWFRVWADGTSDTRDASGLEIFALDETGSWQYQGDGTSGIYIWGAQLEEGTRPTSYIPTEGSQVTRIADTPNIPVGDWFNPYGGTFVVEGEAQSRGTGDDGNIATLLKVGDTIGSTGGLAIDRVGGTNDYFARSRASDGGLTALNLGYAPGTAIIAMAYIDGGDIRGALNGGDVVTGANRWDGAGDFLYIGAGGVSGPGRDLRRANGPISRITYYPRALSNEQLQALTS